MTEFLSFLCVIFHCMYVHIVIHSSVDGSVVDSLDSGHRQQGFSPGSAQEPRWASDGGAWEGVFSEPGKQA